MSERDTISQELESITDTLSTLQTDDGKIWRALSPARTVYFDEETGMYTTEPGDGTTFRLDGRGVRIGIIGTGIPASLRGNHLFDDPARTRDCVGSILQSKKTQAFTWRIPQAGQDARYVSKQSIIEQGYYDQSGDNEAHDLFTCTLLEQELFGATFYTAKVASSYAYTANKVSQDYTWEYRYDAYYSSSKSISMGIGWLLDEQVDIICFTMEILGLLPLETDSVEQLFQNRANSKITAHGQDDASMLVFCPVGNQNANDPASMGVFARSSSVIAVSAVEPKSGASGQYQPTGYAKLATAAGNKPDLVGIGRTGQNRGTSYIPVQMVVVYAKILSLTRHYMNRLGYYPENLTPRFLYDEIIEPGAVPVDPDGTYKSQIGSGRLINLVGALEAFFRIFPTTRGQQLHDALLVRQSGMALRESHIQLPYRTAGSVTVFFDLGRDNDPANLEIGIGAVIAPFTRIYNLGERYKAVCIRDMATCYETLQQNGAFTDTLTFTMADAPQEDDRQITLHFWPASDARTTAPEGYAVVPDDYHNLAEKVDDYIDIFETFKAEWNHIIKDTDAEAETLLRDTVKLLFNHIGTGRFVGYQQQQDTEADAMSFFTDHFEWLQDHTSLNSNESAVLHLNESLLLTAQGKKDEAARQLDAVRNGCDPEIRNKIDQVKLVLESRSTDV